MDKMMWSKPEMNEFAFAANEYVAASCGDSGKTYKFKCDADAGQLFYYSNLRVEDHPNAANWTADEWDQYNAQELGYFTPCPVTHEADAATGFFWGFIDWFNGDLGWWDDDKTGRNDRHDAGETVIVWRGPNGKNGHATKQLDMSKWEFAKS